MIAETSYPYTTEDGDGCGNSMEEYLPTEGYTATLQGQASEIRDVCAMAVEAEGLGVFYWGGIWIPVGSDRDSNAKIWEEFGSGWASSAASDYDKENVGNDYGGCSWENQALFDFTGHPLETLNVFKYLKYGTISEDGIAYIPDTTMDVVIGSNVVMPASVEAVHYDKTKNAPVKVTWNEEDVKKINAERAGQYGVRGVAENGDEVKCIVTVGYVNLLLNPGFEELDKNMWKVTNETGDNPTDYQEKEADAHSGDFSFHYWSSDAMDFSIEQTVTGLQAGTYTASVYSQGGDFDDTAVLEFYVVSDGETYTESFMNNGWCKWRNPRIKDVVLTGDTITVGVRIKGNPGSWGTLDDFTLNKVD